MRHRLAVVAVVALVVLAGCSGGGGSSTATEGEPTPTDTPVEPKGTPTDAPADGGATPTDAPGESTPTATPTPGDTPTATEGATPTATEGATPTATARPTPTATPTDDSDDSSDTEEDPLRNGSVSSGGSSSFLDNATMIEVSIRNSSGQNVDFLLKNDTDADRALIQLTRSTVGTTTYYLTEEYNAMYNETTGEILYGQGDQGIELRAGFTAFYAFIPLSYVGVMNWSVTDIRAVDGQERYVYESNSINQTALDQSDFQSSGEIQSAEGRMVVTEDVLFPQISINLTYVNEAGTTAEVSVSMTMTDDDVTVEVPDWFDESEAESQTSSDE